MSAAHKAVAGQSRPCVHTRVHHEHGTYNRAHLDGCRCRACTRAHRRRRKLYAAGLRPVLPPMVPAVRVAEHISALVESGLTHHDIAQRAGLSYLSVRRHAYRREGRPPATWMRPGPGAVCGPWRCWGGPSAWSRRGWACRGTP